MSNHLCTWLLFVFVLGLTPIGVAQESSSDDDAAVSAEAAPEYTEASEADAESDSQSTESDAESKSGSEPQSIAEPEGDSPRAEKQTADQSSNEKEIPSANPPAQKKSKAKPRRRTKVKWYQPDFVGYNDDTKRVELAITGKTYANSVISVGGEEIVVIDKQEKSTSVPAKSTFGHKHPVKANKEGEFEIRLRLPEGLVMIPLKASHPSGKLIPRVYQLPLQVSKDQVVIKSSRVAKRPVKKNKWEVWGGLGFYYLNYSQEIPGAGQNAGLNSFALPAIYAKGVYNFDPQKNLNLEYKLTPGSVTKVTGLTLAKPSFGWTIIGVDFSHRPIRLKSPFNDPGFFGYRVGIQQHFVPFISRTGASETEVTIESNGLTMFSLGWHLEFLRKNRWSYEAFMRLQHPLSVGSVFEMTPNFGFDGSLGVNYILKNGWAASVSWYGQWHDYSFRHFDKVSQESISGAQVLFFSTLEARVGYTF